MIAQFLCWLFANGVWVDPITGKYTCNGDFNWWFFILFIFLFYVIGNILVDIYFGPVPDDEPVHPYMPDPWRTQLDPDRVTLTKLTDGRTQMDYRGQHKTFHFLWWRDTKTDMPVVQRTNEHGQYYHSPVHGSPNSWRFGSNPDDSLFDHIRYTINTEDK